MIDDYLASYRDMLDRIKEREIDCRIMYNQMTKTTANYDGDGTTGGDPLDRKREMQARYADAKQAVADLKEKAEIRREEIRVFLEGIPEYRQKRILQLYYCDLVDYDKIGEIIGYSRARVFQLRSEGIKYARELYRHRR